ncbi:MAG: SLC13 family permease [Nitrospinota bacterium]
MADGEKGFFGKGLFGAFALILFLLLRLGPALPGLPPAGQGVLAVAAAAVVLWVGEVVPVAVSGLAVLALLGLSGGVRSVAGVFYGFSSPVVFFLVGSSAMGFAAVKTGLADRLARFLLRRAGGEGRRLLPQLLLSLPPMALLLPSAITRNAILIPVYLRLFRRLGWGPGDRPARAIMLALGILNPLASSALLTGGTVSFTAATLLGGVGWWEWFFAMSLPYYLLLAGGGTLLFLLYPGGASSPSGPLSPEAEEPPGPLRPSERGVLAVIGGASVLWALDFVHGLSPALPALLALLVLSLPRVGAFEWREFEREFSWSTVIVLGAALSLARALEGSGAAGWLAGRLLPLLPEGGASPALWAGALVATAAFLHLGVANLAAFLSLFIPIASSLGRAAGLNPFACGLLVTLATDAVILYPVQTATSILAYEAGYYRAGEVIRLGLAMLALLLALLPLAILPWWGFLGRGLAP